MPEIRYTVWGLHPARYTQRKGGLTFTEAMATLRDYRAAGYRIRVERFIAVAPQI